MSRFARRITPFAGWWLTGAVTALVAFAPVGVWPVLVVAFALLTHRLQEVKKPREAGVLSFLFAHGYFTAGLLWISVALARFGGLPWVAAGVAVALLAGYLALWWGVAGWLTVTLWQRLPVPSPLVLASLWTLAEWGRGLVLTGFPWLMPGVAAAAEEGVLNGWFPVVGALGVTFLLLWVAAQWGVAARTRTTWVATLAVVGIGAGLAPLSWSEPVGEVPVSVIQTAVPQEEKWDRARWALHLEALRSLLGASKGTVVVTPETVLPLFADQLPLTWRERLLDLRGESADAGIVRTVIFGIFRRDGAVIHNSLVTLDGSWHYDKRQLVPFGEFIPLGFHWFVRLLAIPFADQTPGEAEPPLGEWAGAKWAANICYESAFSRWVVRDVRRGAEVLVNASNFAWYGESHGQWQHAQIGRARALETARPWVQAVNAGVSVVFDEKGREVARARPWQPTILEATVVPQRGVTPFVRWGGEATVAFGVLAILGALLSRRGVAAPNGAKIP